MPNSKRKNRVKQWLYGKSKQQTDSSGVLGALTKQPQQENQSGKYFQAIDKLPLSRFIDCLVDQNLYALATEGKPSDLELQAAFADIYQQYTDKMGDGEYKHYISTWKQLIALNCTISQIDAIIEVLKLFPYVPLFDELNALLKTDFKFDYAKKDEYYKLLNRAHVRSRGLVISRDLLQIKFDAIKEKMKGGDKQITRAYFIDWLIQLGNHTQMTITDQITVYEFCERVRQYNLFVERERLKK